MDLDPPLDTSKAKNPPKPTLDEAARAALDGDSTGQRGPIESVDAGPGPAVGTDVDVVDQVAAPTTGPGQVAGPPPAYGTGEQPRDGAR
jgi:hypothetical protein